MTSHRGADPFDNLVLDERFVAGAVIRERDLAEHRAQLAAFGCPECTRRARRRQRWGTAAFALVAVVGTAACVGSAVFASVAATGAI